ncbi:MAG: 3'-5' exonuclease [Parachlamydiaceae bacterium]|nr:3'-5' exonuclease [Parachlamydiaceae bacterium]
MQAIFLDTETTGLDCTKHVAIDIAFEVVDMTTNKSKVRYQSLIKHPLEIWQLADPTSLLINGYTFEQISVGKEVQTARDEIISIFTDLGIERGKAVFICQNPAFDRGFFMQLIDVYTQERLGWPYHWLDFASMYWSLLAKQMVDTKSQFPESLNISKNEIAKVYNLPEENTPHSAMQGVEHLMLCYQTVFGLKFTS